MSIWYRIGWPNRCKSDIHDNPMHPKPRPAKAGAGAIEAGAVVAPKIEQGSEMSELETMQVGSLQLRNTDDGWQYLSEGLGGEPDRWSDAADILGPFGGSGINDLLDALSTAKAALSVVQQDATRFRFIVDCPIREAVAISRKANDPSFDLASECDRLIAKTGFASTCA